MARQHNAEKIQSKKADTRINLYLDGARSHWM